ncbi:chemotaxis protein [Helicobacter sp. MIT 14-3879]|uniref:chemotaxis protein n=1 Tax=Helicobacter sp. MIT 14-3879 TaxID=2040649 RepID=UPI000E1FA301|nr:chemotaxis protein [Helicobacter sp. MIT 14-3879]RDU60843.1 chemotaxis protein CheV [Helicobacter sp. MIT 14-3879]
MLKNIVKSSELHLMNEVQFLCFLLEEKGELYATNVFKVREVVHYTDVLTKTEGEDNDVVLGFITMRGESIPLLDLRRWLFFDPNNALVDLREYSIDSSKYLIIICDFSGYTVGLRIHSVKRIIQRNWDEVVTGTEYGFQKNGKVIATTKFDDGKIVQVLDVEKMLGEIFPMVNNYETLNLQTLEKIKSNKIILLAEDSKPVAKSMQIILEKLGLRYYSFPNGKELLQYLKTENDIKSIGAIITDLEMPIISGFEVLKQVKENDTFNHIPVIVNTSMSSESNISLAKSLKADVFLTKLKPAELEYELRRLLEGK